MTTSISGIKLLQKKAYAMPVTRLKKMFSIYIKLDKHEKELDKDDLFV